MMEQVIQCPVCTLYLHNGISLESHLDTHPKDQVIKALCNLSATKNSYGSRASTPMHSERSYRSRSRTPATEDPSARWANSHFGPDQERYWRHAPSRTSKSSTVTKDDLPSDLRTEPGYQSDSMYSYMHTYPSRSDTAFTSVTPTSDFETKQNTIFGEPRADVKEIKYSRSSEYSALSNPSSTIYESEVEAPSTPPGMKYQPSLVTSAAKRSTSDYVNFVPATKKQYVHKHNNIALMKTNVGSVQYITPGVLMTSPKFIKKSPSNNFLVTPNVQSQSQIQTKVAQAPVQPTVDPGNTTNLMPNTTVVAQNSQIIYQEVVQNINGKSFIVGVPPAVGNHDNLARTSSMYQNVMVLDQFGNASCMYSTPNNQLLHKSPKTPNLNQTCLPSATVDKNVIDPNKTMIIEIAPIVTPTLAQACDDSITTSLINQVDTEPTNLTTQPISEKLETIETTTKGLKILSNIKVEVPVQHHKSLLNTVVDLTGYNETDNKEKQICRQVPDTLSSEGTESNKTHNQPSSPIQDIMSSNTFSVIKNTGNPISKDSKQLERGQESESSDSFPVPDLTCNEKPSLTPCSELSDNCDNSRDRITLSPKPDPAYLVEITIEPMKEPVIPIKPYRHIPLRLNNIYVKKNKKVLQIKNAKTFPVASTSQSDKTTNPIESTAPKIPENFTVTKIFQESMKEDQCQTEKIETESIDKVETELIDKEETESIEKVDSEHNFDADTEEQSMDLEQEPLNSNYNTSTPSELVHVKEEVNTSDEVLSNQTGLSDQNLSELESLRPITASHYGEMEDFDEDSNHRELLELEAASKNKHFATMINENYFGDNVYADYFTPDRVEAFDAERESNMYDKTSQREFWGEPSQKPEYILGGLQDDEYKGEEKTEKEIDISADERMPPRGEISGDSNTELDPWSQPYAEMGGGESYDLIARESWLSDGSDLDDNEKRDKIELSVKGAGRLSAAAGMQDATPRLLDTTTPLLDAANIKRETTDDAVLQRILADTKPPVLPPSLLNVYETIAQPKIETSIKQERKKRKREWPCGRCGAVFPSSAALAPHLREHPLECLTCGKEFQKHANLQLHLKTHLDIKNYKCEVCGKRFITRQKLSEHTNIHTGRTPVKCTLCEQTFRRFSNMVQHRDRFHLKKKPRIRDFVCMCGAVFHTAAKLRWHRETHDEKPKSCQFCSERFVHSASLTRHVRRAHDRYYTGLNTKKNQNVVCHICNQVYLAGNLKTHMETHSGKKPYQCVICNKCFSTKWNLKLHRWTHMSRSSKPFKCPTCPSAFIRQPEFVAHMNAHKSVRPYTCNYCGCQFIRKYNCVRHVREHETAKKYVCAVPDCGKTFHRSYYLSEHMKVHSGARPFSCNICGKTSSNKSNHNKHLKIHHAREPVATEG